MLVLHATGRFTPGLDFEGWLFYKGVDRLNQGLAHLNQNADC